MKAIFYALSLLVIGAAAFFSFQNVGKFQEQQDIKVKVIADNEALTKKKENKQKDLEAEIVTRNETNRQREELKSSIESLKAKGKQLVRDIKALDETLQGQKVKFAELEESKTKLNEILKEQGVNDISEVPGKIAELKAEQTAKTKALEELKTAIAALEKNVAQNSEEISRLAERDASRDTRMRRNAMESVVTAVNEDWGFVIIGAGSNTGFTPQTKLLVKRDGRLIGMVKPSSIEPSQVVAEIDADSIAPGVRIQPGDRVILGEPASN